MGILQIYKKCLYLVNSLILLASLILISCEQKVNKPITKVNCVSVPEIIKLEGEKDTLVEGERYHGRVIFSEELDKRINARIFVLDMEIYFNRDTTKFVYTPKFNSLDKKERKEIQARVILKYDKCLDTTIHLSQFFILKR